MTSLKLDRRTFLTANGAALAARPFGAASMPANKRQPNVVLIMADDLGYETLGVNGGADYQTPVLDRLANAGVRFTQCHVNPLCTPTRCTLMTGRYNYRNYIGFGHLKRNDITFAHMLKNAGYATAAAGKWQLGNGSQHDQSPGMAGFDEYCLWNIEHEGALVRNERYADPNFLYYDRETGSPVVKQFKGEYGPDVCRRYLDEFMTASVDRGQPFFAYYPMILTHDPFKPTPHSPSWKNSDRHQKDRAFFKDMVEYMDFTIGQIESRLDELGARDNTIIIFLGDNGTHKSITSRMNDGRAIQGGKARLTDAGTHVPLIVNAPGSTRGRVINTVVTAVDLLPTLADLCGAAPPQPLDGALDGVSLAPLLSGEADRAREWILVEYFEDRHQRNDEGRFVRNERYKLYGTGLSPFSQRPLYKGGGFYDLQNDPGETRSLSIDELQGEARAVYERLQSALNEHPLPDTLD